MSIAYDEFNVKMSYLVNVFVAFDQLGNALADGNPDNTISSRIGYFAADDHDGSLKPYWKSLERVLDFTFAPIEGPNHCYRAWKAEEDEKDRQGTDWARALLGFFIMIFCPIVGVLIRLTVAIYPPWRYDPQKPGYDTWRRARRNASIQRSPTN